MDTVGLRILPFSSRESIPLSSPDRSDTSARVEASPPPLLLELGHGREERHDVAMTERAFMTGGDQFAYRWPLALESLPVGRAARRLLRVNARFSGERGRSAWFTSSREVASWDVATRRP